MLRYFLLLILIVNHAKAIQEGSGKKNEGSYKSGNMGRSKTPTLKNEALKKEGSFNLVKPNSDNLKDTQDHSYKNPPKTQREISNTNFLQKMANDRSDNNFLGPQDSKSSVARDIKTLLDEKNKLVENLQEKSHKMKVFIEKIQTWEEGQSYKNSGPENIDNLQAYADHFAVELATRKQLETDSEQIIKLIEQIKMVQTGLNVKKEIATLKNRHLELGMQPDALGVVGIPNSSEGFEFYELKEPADVIRVSAHPDVYGDQGYWKFLFQVNKEIIKNPDRILPIGTVLKVPNITRTRDFGF